MLKPVPSYNQFKVKLIFYLVFMILKGGTIYLVKVSIVNHIEQNIFLYIEYIGFPKHLLL